MELQRLLVVLDGRVVVPLEDRVLGYLVAGTSGQLLLLQNSVRLLNLDIVIIIVTIIIFIIIITWTSLS